MAAGVRQGHMLAEHMPSMGDQTDVGMEREDLGQMMSTESQVCSVYLYISKMCFKAKQYGQHFRSTYAQNCCIAS